MSRTPAHHYHPMVRSVARALRQRCGVSPGTAIVVGCSGGADSVALLRALTVLAGRRKWRLRLIVGHVQHHLRDEAEDDARFVAALAERLGLACVRRDIRPGEMPGNLEANARELRYKALAEIAAEHRAGFIATAHHADDQLETLLMRMLRGASVAGLRGIAWHKPLADHFAIGSTKTGRPLCVIRPMLSVGRDGITALLDELGQNYREDATNLDTDRTRARLRHDVLPVLKALQHDAPQKACDLAEHFSELYEVLRQNVETQVTSTERTDRSLQIPREAARRMSRAVLAELLREAMIDLGTPAGKATRNALLPAVAASQDSAGGTRVFSFANAVTLTITRGQVRVQATDAEAGNSA
ncbi:MAG: tRNA lysidine(34) synthetase TilS [Planctomycetota bacterium]